MNKDKTMSMESIRTSGFVCKILSFKVIGYPGCAAVEVLKNHETGQTGVKIVQISELVGGYISYQ